MSTCRVALTARDRTLVHAAWSLGWATSTVLRDLVAPATSVKTLTGRLTQLAHAGYLRRLDIPVGPGPHLWLYGAGRSAPRIDPAYREAWRPSESQLAHTVAVSATLGALARPGALGAIEVTEWYGEAELRTWHEPGAPVPDLLLRWVHGTASGRWAVEVDRGTQARAAWRRKLVRYVHAPQRQLFVVTTSDERARNLARLAREMGVNALTVDRVAISADAPFHVYDAAAGRHRPVDEPTE
jgi:hypothetical protein